MPPKLREITAERQSSAYAGHSYYWKYCEEDKAKEGFLKSFAFCEASNQTITLGRRYCRIEGCQKPKNGWSKSTSGDSIDFHMRKEHAIANGDPTNQKLPFRPSNFEEHLVRAIADCHLPASIIDRTSFKQLLLSARMLHNSCDIPSSTTLRTKLIPKSAEKIEIELRAKVKNRIAASITFDIWSKFRNSYISVIAYIVCPEFVLNRLHFGVVEFNESHTSENIADKLIKLVENMDLSLFNDIVSVTHDAASNNTGRKFVESIPWEFKICCLAHKASNASKMIFKQDSDAKRVLEICKRLTRALGTHHLWSAMKAVSAGSPRVLPRFSDTRFNGGFIVFQSLLSQKERIEKAIDFVQAHNRASFLKLSKNLPQKEYSAIPTRMDWDIIKDLVTALQPLNDFIVEIQDRRTTLSDALMKFRRLKLILTKAKVCNTYHLQLIEAINHYFQDIEHPLSAFTIAFALDPRTVKSGVSEQTWDKIAQQMEQFYGTAPSKERSPVEIPTEDQEMFLAMMGLSRTNSVADLSSGSTAKVQLSKFRNWARAPMEMPLDAFWNSADVKAQIPLVRRYAARFFSMQATEVENEREFSSTGSIFFVIIA